MEGEVVEITSPSEDLVHVRRLECVTPFLTSENDLIFIFDLMKTYSLPLRVPSNPVLS